MISVEVFMQCLVVGVGLSSARSGKPTAESWAVPSVSQRTPLGRQEHPFRALGSSSLCWGSLLSLPPVLGPDNLKGAATPKRLPGAPALLPALPGPHLSSHRAGLTQPVPARLQGPSLPLHRDSEPSCGPPGLRLWALLLCPPAFLQLTRPLLARLQ